MEEKKTTTIPVALEQLTQSELKGALEAKQEELLKADGTISCTGGRVTY